MKVVLYLKLFYLKFLKYIIRSALSIFLWGLITLDNVLIHILYLTSCFSKHLNYHRKAWLIRFKILTLERFGFIRKNKCHAFLLFASDNIKRCNDNVWWEENKSTSHEMKCFRLLPNYREFRQSGQKILQVITKTNISLAKEKWM